jgi:uncharacterized protein YbjT (DUF2867 family)
MNRIMLAGATGLVGRQVVQCLSARAGVELHAVLRRNASDLAPSVIQHVAATDDWAGLIADLSIDVAISCLGTTIRTAGSQAAFRAVDYDLAVAFADAAKQAGARQMIVVSSVGASAKSSNFYLKIKGHTEDALGAMGFDRLDIIRPGLLTGGSRADSRPGEAIGIMLSPLTDMLMIGPMARYRSTASAKVAQAIAALALGGGHGQHIHENDSIRALTG